MKRVLFVDDEKNVLNGLRRMLRGIRDEWEMDFAPGGAEALELIAEKDYDLVISDMRMPGMDGAELLTRVQEMSPETVRIVLSGHSEQNMVMKSVKPAHQYLSKPCSADLLLKTLKEAYRLRRLLSSPRIKAAVSSVDTLPSMPDLYQRIVNEIDQPGSTLERVGEIIAEDVGMTAMILKMINSSFFGFFRKINTPGQAVSLLGVEVVKALVLSGHLFSSFSSEKAAPSFDMESFMKHSLMVAKLAEAIAEAEGVSQQTKDQCSIAGMLHDMGKLIMSTQIPEQYEEILRAAKAGGMPQCDVEESLLDTTHGEVGAYLLGLWGVDRCIIETIAFHNHPEPYAEEDFSMLAAVHAADYFEYKLLNVQDASERELDMDYLASCNMADRVDRWESACANVIDEVKKHEQ